MAKVIIGSVSDAFRKAKVSDAKARAAAMDLADDTDRFAAIEQRISNVHGRVGLVQWMLGVNLAGTLLITGRTFFS